MAGHVDIVEQYLLESAFKRMLIMIPVDEGQHLHDYNTISRFTLLCNMSPLGCSNSKSTFDSNLAQREKSQKGAIEVTWVQTDN